MSESRVFVATLMGASALGAAVALFAFTRAPSTGLSVNSLPERVTTMVFGEPEARRGPAPEWGPPALRQPRTRVMVQDLSFIGLGDVTLASFLVERYVSELSVCYDEQDMGQLDEVVVVVRRGQAQTLHPDPARQACLAGLLQTWPWPSDLSGSLTLSLRAGAAI